MRRLLNLILIATFTATTACSSDSDGLTEPDVPTVSGVWTGSVGGAGVRLSLSQRGTAVTGTFSVGTTGGRNYDVTGTVNELGILQWSTDQLALDCSTYSSPGMQLENSASTLTGPLSRISETPPCDGGRRQVQRSTTTLTRAF